MTITKKHLPIAIIVIFHVVGLVGFKVNPEYFKQLTSVNLVLSVFLVLLMSNQSSIKFYGSFLFVAFAGYVLEVIGVKTGLIFGNYYYGNALGFKLFDVPLLIGINWAVLIYAISQFTKFDNKWINALIGASLMTFLDFFIEQSASKFDFWYWQNDVIPIKNYVAWFVISFVLNIIVQKILAQKPNFTAKWFYVVQVCFFVILFYI